MPAPSLTHDMPMAVHPGYLAGPGDGAGALHAFVDSHDDWNLFSGDRHQLIAAHERSTALVTLDSAAPGPHAWSIVSFASPSGTLEWHAGFTATTPAEIVAAVADRLASAMSKPTATERDLQLWGHDHPSAGTADALDTETARAHQWIRGGDLRTTRTLDHPDGTASLRIHRFIERPGTGPLDTVFTLAAGARGDEPTWWKAEFSRYTPTTLLTAALQAVTDPDRCERRASQIPMLHRSLLRTHPVAARPPRTHL
ncbi:DUF317 domain-containing protein [Kitasatospora sp. NPDC057965]|uniref:DUF317 domain-containing protein n=1 Tax=Kitasatospora sp. NPDC057965 TaxID=3346291 RepID=UPI0036D97EA8